MPKKIEDEFSAIPCSRQQKWQMRMRVRGRCVKCGRVSQGQVMCEKHRKQHKKIEPLKAEAYRIVAAALRTGKLKRRKCECGVLGQAHHEDYSKPLEVTWLCHRCHNARHGKWSYKDRLIKV